MKYVVYLTLYSGTILPRWYIGSTNIDKIKKGYNGSIRSVQWKTIYKSEQEFNKHLFKTKILSYHKTRKEALEEELRLQRKHNVIKNDKYINKSFAVPNGFFGRTMDETEKKQMVASRRASGNGDYHHGKQPMLNPKSIDKMRETKIKNGNWQGLDISYKGVKYKNIKSLCEAIGYSQKKLRRITTINKIKYVDDFIIDTIFYLESLEPKDKKWMFRNTIQKNGIKFLLYFKLEVPEGFILIEEYQSS